MIGKARLTETFRCADAPSRSAGLWLTPDQQGRIAFDRGDYATAAKLFADPMWRGIAASRAFDFLAAAEAFVRSVRSKAASRSARPADGCTENRPANATRTVKHRAIANTFERYG